MILNILSIVVLFHFSIRIAVKEKPYIYWLLGTAFALLNWFILPIAYENRLPVIVKQISTGIWADNFVLVVSLDVLLGLVLCYRALRKQENIQLKYKWVEYIPSLLLLPVLYYLNANFFYAFPQFNYTSSGIILFILISVGLPLWGYFFRWLLRESYAIIEFKALLNLSLLALILIAPLLRMRTPGIQSSLHLDALIIILTISLVGFVLGLVVFKIKQSIITNK